MDRFIAVIFTSTAQFPVSLKSNMDRFIVSAPALFNASAFSLKSNMDRFIGQRLRSLMPLLFL